MPIPANLIYVHGIAHHGARWYVLCQRDGHRVTKTCHAKRDAEAWLARHVAEEHTSAGKARGAVVRLGDALDAFEEHVAKLARLGKRHPHTERYYVERFRRLREWLPLSLGLHAITQAHIREYAMSRLTHPSTQPGQRNATTRTHGACVVKELRALRTVYRHHGMTPGWSIPKDDIRPEKREKPELALEEIRAFVGALRKPPEDARGPAWTQALAMAMLKLRTGLRTVEIRNVRAGDVDLTATPPRLTLMRHAKKNTKEDAWPLSEDCVEALRPLLAGKAPEARLFRDHGCTGVFRQASERAGINPPLSGLSHLRNSVITASVNAMGVGMASLAWHDDERTTRGYVFDSAVWEAKMRVWRSICDMIPL